MMNQRMPYDKSTAIWSPDGELVQLEYARKASERGAAACAVIAGKSIVLGGEKSADPLMESQPKIRQIDDKLYMIASGLTTDANLLISQARIVVQQYRLIYGEFITPKRLASMIGDLMARHTISGGLRPFGVSLLISGFDITGTPQILWVDNGGTFHTTKAYAIGRGSDEALNLLRTEFSADGAPKNADDAKKLVLQVLAKARAEESIPEEEVDMKVLT
ncbi:MAG: proteasome subunit alpha [Candidatus Heimdallarchaeota archaeon]